MQISVGKSTKNNSFTFYSNINCIYNIYRIRIKDRAFFNNDKNRKLSFKILTY